MIKSISIDDFVFGPYKLNQSGPSGMVFVLGKDDQIFTNKLIDQEALAWQALSLKNSKKEVLYFLGKSGPIWILNPSLAKKNHHEGGFERESLYSWSRESMGSLLSHFQLHHLKSVQLNFRFTQEEIERGCLVGLALASYQYKTPAEGRNEIKYYLQKQKIVFNSKVAHAALIEAEAINTARHLVNLPPNELGPLAFANYLERQKWPAGIKLEIWNEKKLQAERMNLHLAVGQGSSQPPCLVHISYRPKLKNKKNPIAFVGKGICFDSGGLDIKPSSGMRLMKKDMGGAASIAGLAWWVAQTRIPQACDFYLALAENSVGGNSFRPSDVITSRSGLKVEIDNTDAEGRLVLADALDLAVNAKESPEVVIDVATLTGAIKVALGAEVAGLFGNDKGIIRRLEKASHASGDLCWHMPLYSKYFSSLSSPFADFKNSSEGFGGAITAALFLQKFVGDKKWAHLDIYAWNDKPNGSLNMSGGSGQGVQLLIEYMKEVCSA